VSSQPHAVRGVHAHAHPTPCCSACRSRSFLSACRSRSFTACLWCRAKERLRRRRPPPVGASARSLAEHASEGAQGWRTRGGGAKGAWGGAKGCGGRAREEHRNASRACAHRGGVGGGGGRNVCAPSSLEGTAGLGNIVVVPGAHHGVARWAQVPATLHVHVILPGWRRPGEVWRTRPPHVGVDQPGVDPGRSCNHGPGWCWRTPATTLAPTRWHTRQRRRAGALPATPQITPVVAIHTYRALRAEHLRVWGSVLLIRRGASVIHYTTLHYTTSSHPTRCCS
jgi:hypothetical protein